MPAYREPAKPKKRARKGPVGHAAGGVGAAIAAGTRSANRTVNRHPTSGGVSVFHGSPIRTPSPQRSENKIKRRRARKNPPPKAQPKRSPSLPPRKTGVFASPFTEQFSRQGVPRKITGARQDAKRETQRETKKAQGPTLKKFPVPEGGYTFKQLTAITKARAKAGEQALKAGIPRDDVTRYLQLTHDDKTWAPYRRAERQKSRELRGILGPSVSKDYQPPKRRHDVVAKAGAAIPTNQKVAFAQLGDAGKAFAGKKSPFGIVGRDALSLPANVVSGTYATAAAAWEAAHGDTTRGKELVKSFKENDPIALAAQGKFKKAGWNALTHPVSTGLEVRGGVSAIGRVGGKVARSGALGGKVKQAGSTERAPKVLEGTGLTEPRTYSKDLTEKAVQVAVEKRHARRAVKADRKARRLEAEGQHDEAAAVRDRAANKDPGRVSDKDVQRRVDERVAANEDLRRQHRSQIIDTVHRTRIPRRKGGDAVALVAQRIVKPTREDLEAYATELQDQFDHGNLTRAQKAANKRLRASIGRVTRRKGLDFAAVEKAADRYVEAMRPVQDKLAESGMLASSQAEKARLIPYAVRHMDAHHDGTQIVDANGNPLSSAQIRAHMEANGVGEPAFLTQRPNSRGAKNFFKNWTEGAAIGNKARTGEATRRGTFDTDQDVLVEQAAHAQGLVDANEGFQGFVKEFALRSKRGKVKTFQTRKQAENAARELALDSNGDPIPGTRLFRPVKVQPWGGTEEQFAKLLEEVNNHDFQTSATSPVTDAIEAALKGEGDGPYALIPDVAADRLLQHTRLLGAGSGGKVFQLLSSVFRRTVLATSVKWLTGNVVEAGLRSAIDHAGPRSWYVGRKTLKELERIDPKAAEAARVRAVGGGHFSLAGRQSIYRGADQFHYAPPALQAVARGLGAFWRAPGPKHVAKAWGAWTHLVFEGNSMLERHFQTAMAGRYIRSNLMPDHLIKTSQRAIEDAAKGLKGTDAQVAMGRAVDRAYGKYSKFTPGQRKAITMYTPFAAWSLSAARFVFDVLPRDHPVLTGLLAAQNNATKEWRDKMGLDPFLEGAVPGFLQGSVPTHGGWIRASRYTPFGAFSDPGDTLAGLLLPQLSGPVLALQGRDWKGDPLNGAFGPEATPDEKFAAAFQSFLESTVPFSAQADRVTANPDGVKAGILKEVNPVAPVSRSGKKKKAAGGSSSSGGGGGGWGGGSASPKGDKSTTGGW